MKQISPQHLHFVTLFPFYFHFNFPLLFGLRRREGRYEFCTSTTVHMFIEQCYLSRRKCVTKLSLFYLQVVIRVRKRVTLMVVTVSAIFGICWCTAGTIYIVSYTAYASVDYNTAVLPISFLTVMFNSTVNPFTYALLNQQFRSKMKMIIFPACFSLSTVQPSVGGESGST